MLAMEAAKSKNKTHYGFVTDWQGDGPHDSVVMDVARILAAQSGCLPRCLPQCPTQP